MTTGTSAPTPIHDVISLAGRSAIVTGAAVGIGYGIAYRLAEAGAAVVVADVDGDAAEKAAGRLVEAGFRAMPVTVDVSDPAGVAGMLEGAVREYGGVDILVNNAGVYPSKLVMDMTDGDFRRVIEVNLFGVFLCTRVVAQHMIERGRGGRIINVTSIDALHPSSAGLAHYDASKHGVWGFTKNVALELSRHRIWVNAIAPGAVATPGAQAQSGQVPQGVDMAQVLQQFLARIPMGRIGEPDDIGKVALFLASDLSSYLTGTQLVVDGGVLLS